MSLIMNPVKLGDIVFQLSEETKNYLAQKGDLAGRSVSFNKENVSPSIAQANSINQFIKSKIDIMRGLEINSDLVPSNSFVIPSNSLAEIRQRITAYQTLSGALESINNVMANRLKGVSDQQCAILQKQAELLEDIDSLTSDYSEIAARVLDPSIIFSELSPEDQILCYDLACEKERVENISRNLSQMTSSTHPQIDILRKSIAKVEQAPFIEPYRQFHWMKDNITSSLTQEEGDIYIKKLIRCVDKIKPILTTGPLELIQGKLTSDEDKTIFYCMVKLQDEIQELYKWMHQNKIQDRFIKEPELAQLVALVTQLAPLKPLVTQAPLIPVEIPQIGKISIAEAEESYRKALGEQTPSKAQHLFWQAARGFCENGQPVKAMEILETASRKMDFPADHPMMDFPKLLSDRKNFGRDFSGMGGNCLKEQTLHATSCIVDGSPTVRFDFKLNNHGRRQMDTLLKAVNSEFLMKHLPAEFCQGIKITERPAHVYIEFQNDQFTSATHYTMPGTTEIEIEFTGVGKVIMGTDPGNKTLYNTIYADVIQRGNPKDLLKKVHTMLTMLGCPPVLAETTLEDKQQRALLHVYRCFYPAEAYILEKDVATYTLSPAKLQDKICEKNSAMAQRFKEHLTADLLPKNTRESPTGKIMTALDISEDLRRAGAWGLMHGMGGSVAVNAPRVSSMLRSGLLASQRRFQAGILAAGLSSHKDHQEGGAEGVFTRMVTTELAKNNPIAKIAASGNIQFLIDLKAINGANTYGYEDDAYGSRKSPLYQHRRNLIDLTAQLQKPLNTRFGRPVAVGKYGTANEVIMRDQVMPEHIRGIVVQTKEDKETLINQLKKDKVLEQRGDVWYYKNTKIDDFILVSANFSKEMWHAP